ncbi:flagellar biosynthetic protein FliO [uncultured Sneathiella sp.]|uniref:flagellar biosynthetic protein FliO n=1 Tax=uncultured Sneathiella sp. TaxID=879315 RepID=UPI0030EF9A4E|tara:strand:+ start:27681 stop:27986 length:306 start_codon:yes stop_codon:yes gene_type:complete
MEPVQYLKYIVGLLVVLGLIALITLLARRFGMVPRATRDPSSPKRLSVTDVIAVDAKRRLVLVKRDDREHLLLLGPERDLVVEQNIPSKNTAEQGEMTSHE